MRRTLITNRARAMRKSMSDAEVLLWIRLRGRGPDKPTFRRQHPFGSIILDFYCPSAALAVEVDGRTHCDDDARERDAARDIWLARQGIEVMRIPASRVYRALDEVTDSVLLRADERRRRLPREAAGGGPRPAEGVVEGAGPELHTSRRRSIRRA